MQTLITLAIVWVAAAVLVVLLVTGGLRPKTPRRPVDPMLESASVICALKQEELCKRKK